MIDVREIKIGNYLLYDGKLSKVTCVDLDLDDEGVPLVSFEDSSPVELNYGRVEAVQLTPELLEKCGFVRMEDEEMNECFCYGDNFTIWVFNNNEFSIDGYSNAPLKNLHQLQNLLFALTGEELPITM